MYRRRQQRAARARREKFRSRHVTRARRLALEPLEERRLLAVMTVTNLEDGTLEDLAGGGLSLREAIEAINTGLVADGIAPTSGVLGTDDEIRFAPSLFADGPESILLAEAAGELRVTAAMTISGPGADRLTIDASSTDPTPDANNGDGTRVLYIDDGDDGIDSLVTISGLTLTGGDEDDDGGAILSLESLDIADSAISGNSSLERGGGIYAYFYDGSISISDSVISGNIAEGDGGGLYTYGGAATITNSAIFENSARDGGGIYTDGGALTISSSTISGNHADDDGGGIYLDRGLLNISNSTISGNHSDDDGGGISTYLDDESVLTIRHSTITGNTSDQDASGYGSGGGMHVYSDHEDYVSTVRIENTIIAGNRDNSGTARDVNIASDGDDPTLIARFNLIGDGTNSGVVNGSMGNQVGTAATPIDPKLFPLADNGGPTETHRPMPDSPAIDLGNSAAFAGVGGVPLFDQRGEPFARVLDGDDNGSARIDIGAVEAENAANGPRVVELSITNEESFPLFNPKPTVDGPTPLVNGLTIRIQDFSPVILPLLGDYNDDGAVDIADYIVWRKNDNASVTLPNDLTPGDVDDGDYQVWRENFGATHSSLPVVNLLDAQLRDNYQLVGDVVGSVRIAAVQVVPDETLPGEPAGASILLSFDKPLADDRYTLTVSDEISDIEGNQLDGESDADEPGLPTFPSGNGRPGGNFVARFTIDSRPEIGSRVGTDINIDINGNRVWDPMAGAGGELSNVDLQFNLQVVGGDGLMTTDGFRAHDQLIAGKFVNPESAPPNSLFDQLAAYGYLPERNIFRWLIDTDGDGVVEPGQDFNATQPSLDASLGFNIATALAVAGDFDATRLGDEIGLYDAGKWAFDTNGDHIITGADRFITNGLVGYPAVGDFDGDSKDDLAVFSSNTWFFDLANDGLGSSDTATGAATPGGGSADKTLVWGLPGNLERPVVADMDQDGIDDIGLWLPNSATSPAKWHFLISNGASNQPGEITALSHAFLRPPHGSDYYAEFGGVGSWPIVGNFDPPPSGAPAAASVDQAGDTQSAVGVAWQHGTSTNALTLKRTAPRRQTQILPPVADAALTELYLSLTPRQRPRSSALESLRSVEQQYPESKEHDAELDLQAVWGETSPGVRWQAVE